MHQKTSTNIRRILKQTKNLGGAAVNTCLHREPRCSMLHSFCLTICPAVEIQIFCSMQLEMIMNLLLSQTIFFWTLIARNISRVLDRHGVLSSLWDQSSSVEIPGTASRAQMHFSEEQNKQIEAAFRLFDTDGSNILEEHEMRSALFALGYLTGPQSSSAALEWSCSHHTGRPGCVNLEQFREILRGSAQKKSHLEEIRKTFCAIVSMGWIDRDEAQSPPVEELLKRRINLHNLQQACQRFEVRLTEDELIHIIQETDRDESNDVDWEEYVFVLKHSCWF